MWGESMSQYNIGPKIGIEGEGQFRTQISRINSEYRSMDSYLTALEKSMEQNGRSQEALASKSNVLRQQLSLQEQRYAALEDALSKATKAFGAGSDEVMRLQGALLDVDNTMTSLAKELDSTESELRNLSRGVEVVGDSADTAETQVMSFGDMLKAGIASGAILNTLERTGELVLDIGGQAIEAAADVKAANAQFSQTFGDLESTATTSLRAIADETGIATTRLQEGYTALYAFTKSVGGDSATALDIAQRALTAAADSAAYYDRSVEDATETLQSFLKGNYENDAALGIAATETTRNAKANELYAKSFKDLTEAQKVDVLLAMVEAGNAASGALGQAAREADSWTNVTGELSEAWKQFLAGLGGPVLQGLTPLIQTATKALKSFTQETSFDKLSREIGSFQTGMENAQAALDDSNVSMQATAGLAGQYVRRLEEIEAAGLDTADAQRDYAQTVELLNTLMPDLGLTINQTTGRLDQNTDSIYANIDSLTAQAQEQAKQAYYKTILDEQSAAYEALFAAEMRQKELLAEQAVLIDNGAKSYDTLAYAQSGSSNAMVALNATLTEEDKRLAEVNLELTALSGEIDKSNGIIASAEEEFNTATTALDGYGKASERTTTVAQQQAASQKAVADAFAEAKAAARESIDSQIGLFEELADKNEWSAEKIIENWKNQQTAFSGYSENLQKAVDMGLDETLVQQLSDGSQQSMMILDAMLNDAKLSVGDINAAFAEMNGSKEAAVSAMTDVRTGMSSEYAQLQQELATATQQAMTSAAAATKENSTVLANAVAEARQGATAQYTSPLYLAMKAGGESAMKGGSLGIRNNAYLISAAVRDARLLSVDQYGTPLRAALKGAGEPIMTGAALGITNNTWRVKNAMKEAADAANRAYKNGWQINSPSRVMEENSDYIVDGAVLQIRRRSADMARAMSDLAHAGQVGYQDQLDVLAAYPSMMAGTPGYGGATSTSTRNVSYGGISININAQPGQDAQSIADAVIDVLTMQLGREEATFG